MKPSERINEIYKERMLLDDYHKPRFYLNANDVEYSIIKFLNEQAEKAEMDKLVIDTPGIDGVVAYDNRKISDQEKWESTKFRTLEEVLAVIPLEEHYSFVEKNKEDNSIYSITRMKVLVESETIEAIKKLYSQQ